MNTLTRFDVFVPGDFPRYSYVHRKFKNPRTDEIIDPEQELLDALRQQGMIAQVVGPSKSGKTRAIENCLGLENITPIPGSQITESTSLWDIVIRKTKTSKSTEISITNTKSTTQEIKTSLEADLFVAKTSAELSAGRENSSELGKTEAIEHDSFETATRYPIKNNKILFLDDFHTIPDQIKPIVAAQIKAAAQIGVKICLAEVPHHSHATISALPDLTGRIQKIQFHYWSDDDLIAIGQTGFSKLNTEFSAANLAAFASEAAGSPQLMQLICLNAADFIKINQPCATLQINQFNMDELRKVFIKTHGTVDREHIFQILDRGPDERGNARTKYPAIGLKSGDNYEITLAAIAINPPKTALSWGTGRDNISVRIDQVCTDPSNKPARAQITRSLDQIQKLADKNMQLMTILEWNMETGLHILDPYFLFYLRWSEKYEAVRTAITQKSN